MKIYIYKKIYIYMKTYIQIHTYLIYVHVPACMKFLSMFRLLFSTCVRTCMHAHMNCMFYACMNACGSTSV